MSDERDPRDQSPEPYYRDDHVTLYHGDARDVWPTLVFDSVITDPPYGTGYYEHDTDAMSTTMLLDWFAIGPMAVFGWPEHLVGRCVAAGLVPDEWITWWPTNAAVKSAPTKTFARESECIAMFGHIRGVKVPRTAKLQQLVGEGNRGSSHGDPASRFAGDVWTDSSPGVGFHKHLRNHPNEKPLAVMDRLVAAIGEGVILDPFAGSGTTLVAAKRAGHQSMGIEIDEAHCETAAKRLAQGALDFGATA